MRDYQDHFEEEIKEFNYQLGENGLLGALRFINKRTPHQFTGLYKYNGGALSNIVKYDQFEDELIYDDDVPIETTYCSIVRTEQVLEINDATTDERVKNKINTPVISYCGVLMKDKQGKPFGTLCHFDMKRCEERISDFPLLQAAAEILFDHLKKNNISR